MKQGKRKIVNLQGPPGDDVKLCSLCKFCVPDKGRQDLLPKVESLQSVEAKKTYIIEAFRFAKCGHPDIEVVEAEKIDLVTGHFTPAELKYCSVERKWSSKNWLFRMSNKCGKEGRLWETKND